MVQENPKSEYEEEKIAKILVPFIVHDLFGYRRNVLHEVSNE